MSDILASLAAGLAQRWDARLEAAAVGLGIPLDPAQRQRLFAFLGLLGRWNRTFNLSGVRDPEQMVPRHLLDSLAVAPWLVGSPVLDVGTGAGLPGVPLAIACPERRFTLLDSSAKKLRFVTQALLDLGVGNAQVVQARIEAYRPQRKFATIVTRAVASAMEIQGRVAHLLAEGGCMLLMKGRNPEEDLLALAQAGIPHRLHRLAVPWLEGERHLLQIGSLEQPW